MTMGEGNERTSIDGFVVTIAHRNAIVLCGYAGDYSGFVGHHGEDCALHNGGPCIVWLDHSDVGMGLFDAFF